MNTEAIWMRAKKNVSRANKNTKNARTDLAVAGGRPTNAPGLARAGLSSPFGLMGEFDRMFDDFRRSTMMPMARFPLNMANFPTLAEPAVNIQDKGKNYLVTAALPGVSKENLNIHVSNDILEIDAEDATDEEENSKDYIYREHVHSSFYRRIPLPSNIVADEAEARINDGLLEVILPKKAASEKKKLEVK